MTNRPARFTQAELARAAKVALSLRLPGVEIVDGKIRLLTQAPDGGLSPPSPKSPASKPDQLARRAKVRL